MLDFNKSKFTGNDSEIIQTVRDSSEFTETVETTKDNGFYGVFVVKADRGRVNQLMKFSDLAAAMKEFGDYDIDSQGLSLFSAYRWLAAKGSAYIVRIPDTAYKPSNAVLSVRVKLKKGVWTVSDTPVAVDMDDHETLLATDIIAEADVKRVWDGLEDPDDATGKYEEGQLAVYPLNSTADENSISSVSLAQFIPVMSIEQTEVTYTNGQIYEEDEYGNKIFNFEDALEVSTGIGSSIEDLQNISAAAYSRFKAVYEEDGPDVDLQELFGDEEVEIVIPLFKIVSKGWGKHYNNYSIKVVPFSEYKTDNGIQLYELQVIDKISKTIVESHLFSYFNGEFNGSFVGLQQVKEKLESVELELFPEQMGIFEGLMRAIIYHNAKVAPTLPVDAVCVESSKYFTLAKEVISRISKGDLLHNFDFFGGLANTNISPLMKSYTDIPNSLPEDGDVSRHYVSVSMIGGASQTMFKADVYTELDCAYMSAIFNENSAHRLPSRELDSKNINKTHFIIDYDLPVFYKDGKKIYDIKNDVVNYIAQGSTRDDITFWRSFKNPITNAHDIKGETVLALAKLKGGIEDLRVKKIGVKTFMEWSYILDDKNRHVRVPRPVALIPALVSWRLRGGTESLAGKHMIVPDEVAGSLMPKSLTTAQRKALSKYCVNYSALTDNGYVLDSDHMDTYGSNGLLRFSHNIVIINEIKKDIHRIFTEYAHMINRDERLEAVKTEVNKALAAYKNRLGYITYDYYFKSPEEKALGQVRDYIELAPYGTIQKRAVDINVVNQYL